MASHFSVYRAGRRAGKKQDTPSGRTWGAEERSTSPVLGYKSPAATKLVSVGEETYSGIGGVSEYSRAKQSSLLQSVIRQLVDSNDEEERLTKRSKLQDDLEVASERLENLVQEHREKLHGTLSTFKEVDAKIKDSQEQIRGVRASLQSCKTLLRFKRDELKRLWVEDVKYKHMLQMIDSIEEVRSVPDLLEKYRAKKHYLHATELVNNSVARLEGELAGVEALRDLRQELRQQKENLHLELIDELHKHLYVTPTATRSKAVVAEPASISPKKGGTLPRQTRTASRVTIVTDKEPPSQQPLSVANDDEVNEDLSENNPEKDSSHYMAVLIESLSILGRIQDTLEAIQSRMEREFLLIIERASVQVSHTVEQEASHRTTSVASGSRRRSRTRENQPKLLAKMLQICFERFQSVVSAHSVLLGHLQRTRRVYRKFSFQLYEESDVWAAIQHVVQLALEVYLAFGEEGSAPDSMAGFAAFTGTQDTLALFSLKKKPVQPRVTKKPLFRFDASRHAISVSSYMREQRDIELVEGREGAESVAGGNRHFSVDQPSISQHVVCKPSNRNITVAFGPVREFIMEIENALHLQPHDHCRLYHFLHDFVEREFLDYVRWQCFDKMNSAAKPESAKAVAPDLKTMKVTSSKLCVLNSVIAVWQEVEELRQLMKSLPMYSGHFLDILYELLQGYRDSLQLLYKDLTSVPADGGGKGSGAGGSGLTSHELVVSSRWARDEDINRMIRSLPNWMRLRQGKPSRLGGEEEAKQTVYARESETLTANLGAEPLRQSNIVSSHENLRLLAILHESLDWFNGRLKQTVFELTNQAGGSGTTSPTVTVTTDGAHMSRGGGSAMSDHDIIEQGNQNLDFVESLSKVQFDFQSLAETTIIMLHLEVRCHCFYHLLPAVRKSSYAYSTEVEEEPGVKQLAADLKDIDQVMVAVLSSEKYQYLFEGLGHLVASIFISSTHHMKTINTNGIKKMCRNISVLQACLSKITLIREKDLDRARKYFEMLYLNQEEIIHQLMEQGPQFAQRDYTNAITLLAHSHSGGGAGGRGDHAHQDTKLTQQLQQIDGIFSHDAV